MIEIAFVLVTVSVICTLIQSTRLIGIAFLALSLYFFTVPVLALLILGGVVFAFITK